MLILNEMAIFKQIRGLVAKIPKGKVTTYGAIARALGTKDSRLVGWAVYGNTDPGVPCQRVVFKNGSLAPHYVFGGWRQQKKRLIKDGIKFDKADRVDLKKYFWQPD